MKFAASSSLLVIFVWAGCRCPGIICDPIVGNDIPFVEQGLTTTTNDNEDIVVENELLLDTEKEDDNDTIEVVQDATIDQSQQGGSGVGGVIRAQRKGILKLLEIKNLDEQGRQGCNTEVNLKLFDDTRLETFRNPNSCTNGLLRPPEVGNFFGLSNFEGDGIAGNNDID